MAASLPPVNRWEGLAIRGADLFDYVDPFSTSAICGDASPVGPSLQRRPLGDARVPGSRALAALLVVPFVLLFRRRSLDQPATAGPALAAGAFVCFLLSVGPILHVGGRPIGFPVPYGFLHAHFPGFSALRVPARASFFVGLAGSALAAIGTEMLLRAPRVRWQAASIRVAAAAVALLDVAPNALPYKRPVEYDRLRFAMSSTVPSESTRAPTSSFRCRPRPATPRRSRRRRSFARSSTA